MKYYMARAKVVKYYMARAKVYYFTGGDGRRESATSNMLIVNIKGVGNCFLRSSSQRVRSDAR